MERRAEVGALVMAILVVSVLANGVDAQNLYACWGTCYNKCYPPGNGQAQAKKLSCDYKCLKTCLPPPPNGLKLDCEIACNLKRCIPVGIDGAKMESCFGWCTNLCNKLLHP